MHQLPYQKNNISNKYDESYSLMKFIKIHIKITVVIITIKMKNGDLLKIKILLIKI